MPAIVAEGAQTRRAATATGAIGLAAIFVYACQFLEEPSRAAAVLSFAVMTAGAALMAGGLLGFLFGIPRSLQQEAEAAGRVGYRANTNLEQISDWLTKILVGVGLTQIPAIREESLRLVGYVAQGLGNDAPAGAFALALMLYFITAGFLAVYLWTRLFLAPEFASADVRSLAARVERVEQVSRDIADTIQKQAQADAHALTLVTRQIEPVHGLPGPSLAELEEALREASPAVRVQAFNQARETRRMNWRTDKPKMERAIPILRALAACDTERKYHRTHGQLAYALKDQRQPDWKAAEAEFHTAMEIRGASKGWVLYEFCRAICRIQQDEAFYKGRPSDPAMKQRIVQDLAVAAGHNCAVVPFQDEPAVRDWMALNGVAMEDLAAAQPQAAAAA